MKSRWRALALIGVVASAGMAVGNPLAQAKRKASYATGFHIQAWMEQYAVKKGPECVLVALVFVIAKGEKQFIAMES